MFFRDGFPPRAKTKTGLNSRTSTLRRAAKHACAHTSERCLRGGVGWVLKTVKRCTKGWKCRRIHFSEPLRPRSAPTCCNEIMPRVLCWSANHRCSPPPPLPAAPLQPRGRPQPFLSTSVRACTLDDRTRELDNEVYRERRESEVSVRGAQRASSTWELSSGGNKKAK